MTSEHEHIARIRERFARPHDEVSLGIGDDCAVLAPSLYARAWTIDAAFEGVHFSRAFMHDDEIGYRAFMAAASDIAAMAGRANAALCALAFPHGFGDDALDGLLSGIAEAADALGVPVVGGNLARARELSITTTVIGECTRAVSRGGATKGQGVFVSGSVGGAALGLRALARGQRQALPYKAVIERFTRPRARLDLSAALGARASAAIDISDGLAQDLGHLCEASGVGARIELERLPTPQGFGALAAQLGEDPVALLLGGGEDYELLFTADRDAVPSSLGTYIGEVIDEPGVRVVDAHGARVTLPAGFDHFR